VFSVSKQSYLAMIVSSVVYTTCSRSNESQSAVNACLSCPAAAFNHQLSRSVGDVDVFLSRDQPSGSRLYDMHFRSSRGNGPQRWISGHLR